MGRFDKLALITAVLATAVHATNGSRHAHAYYVSQIEGAGLWIWVTGWLAATYAPLALAVWFSRQAKRTASPWMLHLFFPPAACAFFWGGSTAMLSVINDPDFDATLSTPLMPAIFLFFVAMFGYVATAVVRRSSTRQANAKVL